MKSQIEENIKEVLEYIDKQRDLIRGINKAIESGEFIPDNEDRKSIDYICKRGKDALKALERLEELKKKYEQ